MDHRVLHRHLQPPSLAGAVALVQGAEDRRRHQHAGAGVAKAEARLDRRPVGLAGDADRAAGGLRDHVEGQPLLMRAAGAEALDLAIDDARVDFLDQLVIEAEALDRAGRHVLDRDIGLLQHFLDDIEPLRRFQIDRQRLLVDVELVEIPRVVVGLAGAQPAAGIAAPRVLDLDHLGAKPGQHLGRGRARLELGEIHHLDALQKIEVLDVVAHRRSSRCAQMLAHSLRLPAPHRNAFPPSCHGKDSATRVHCADLQSKNAIITLRSTWACRHITEVSRWMPLVTLRSTIQSLEASRALANDGPLRCASCAAASRHVSSTTTCFGSLFGNITSNCWQPSSVRDRCPRRLYHFNKLIPVLGLHLEFDNDHQPTWRTCLPVSERVI